MVRETAVGAAGSAWAIDGIEYGYIIIHIKHVAMWSFWDCLPWQRDADAPGNCMYAAGCLSRRLLVMRMGRCARQYQGGCVPHNCTHSSIALCVWVGHKGHTCSCSVHRHPSAMAGSPKNSTLPHMFYMYYDVTILDSSVALPGCKWRTDAGGARMRRMGCVMTHTRIPLHGCIAAWCDGQSASVL